MEATGSGDGSLPEDASRVAPQSSLQNSGSRSTRLSRDNFASAHSDEQGVSLSIAHALDSQRRAIEECLSNFSSRQDVLYRRLEELAAEMTAAASDLGRQKRRSLTYTSVASVAERFGTEDSGGGRRSGAGGMSNVATGISSAQHSVATPPLREIFAPPPAVPSSGAARHVWVPQVKRSGTLTFGESVRAAVAATAPLAGAPLAGSDDMNLNILTPSLPEGSVDEEALDAALEESDGLERQARAERHEVKFKKDVSEHAMDSKVSFHKSGTELLDFQLQDVSTQEGGQTSRRWSVGARMSTSRSISNQQNVSRLKALIKEEGYRTALSSVVKDIVVSASFDYFSGAMIFSSAVLLGLETDQMAKTGKSNAFYEGTTMLLNFWFILELMLRVYTHRWEYLCGADTRMNWFDTVLVMSSIVDLIFQFAAVGSQNVGRILRLLRLVRVLRTLRMLRSLQYVREFRKIMFSLAMSGRTFVWSMLLLGFVLFCFGVFFTTVAVDFLQGDGALEHPDEAGLRRSFGSLPSTMYTLYLAITNGRGWGEFAELLGSVHPSIMACFLFFFTFSVFCVINVVTSVFVESAMQSSQHYKDLLVAEKILTDQTNVKHMSYIFEQMDLDGSGSISLDEMTNFLENPDCHLQSYLQALDISATDTATLFQLLDHRNCGEVAIDEFCDGCMRLKGTARSFDLHTLRYEQRHRDKRFLAFMQFTVRYLRAMRADCDRLLQDSGRVTRLLEGLGKDNADQFFQLSKLLKSVRGGLRELSPSSGQPRSRPPRQAAVRPVTSPSPSATSTTSASPPRSQPPRPVANPEHLEDGDETGAAAEWPA